MLIKICGITRIEDARAAVDAGADAVGFVFWPDSPRFIDPYRARAIAASLPPFVSAVGVFVNQAADHVRGVASLVRLSAVQLHGDESPAFANSIGRPAIKAMTSTEQAGSIGPLDIDRWPESIMLMFDAQDPVKKGGTGRTGDWRAAAQVAARRPILLAGGLTPDTVADAIACVHPFGVDVSSGVEKSVGIKDHARIRAFVEGARAIRA